MPDVVATPATRSRRRGSDAMGQTYVGVDGTGPGSAALAWALRRAAQRGDRLTLVHVSEDLSVRSESDGRRLLVDALASARQFAPDIVIQAGMLHGSVFRELAALGAPGDLLVLGTDKTGFLRGRLVGSRGVLIATTSRASVAVVPEPGPAGRRGVVVGVDRLGASPPALILAAQEAERLGQELTVLHAVPLQTGDAPGSSEFDALVVRDAAELAVAAAAPPSISTHIARRPVLEALLDAARTAALVVLGTSHGDDPPTIAGPVVHDMLININAPVIVARPGA
jgi:nucleotide-binding universal stress UspA family protein